MHTINTYHQGILDQAKTYEIHLNELRKKYGLPFVIKLFKHVSKETKKLSKQSKKERDPYKKSIEILYPKKNYQSGTDYDIYITLLENSGFKFKKWNEPFVDEDTGNIVSVKRIRFKQLQ